MAKQTFTVGQVLTAAQLTSLQQTSMGGGAASAKTASYTLVAADAGTTISMTSTSATTITVNTGLFAAGDTVFIQNLGSGNCTVTAGTATVSTAGSTILPTNDAGILYFVSTGVAIFYDFIQTGAVSPLTTKGDLYTFSTSDTRLAVGADGTTLVADSSEATGLKWAAPAGGGGMTLLQTVTLSGTSTTTSSFSTAYKSLVLHFFGVTTTINGQITIRVNSNTGNNYGDAFLSDANNTFTINAPASSFRMLDYNVTGTNYSSGKVEFPEYANTSATTKAAIVHQANTAARRTFNIAYITETTAISTLTFLTGSTPTMGGTVLIYGVN